MCRAGLSSILGRTTKEFLGERQRLAGVALDCKSSPFVVNIGGSIPSSPTNLYGND